MTSPQPEHTCHRPGCGQPVPPAMFACKGDWFRLPRAIRLAIWRHYRPGQENDKRPSAEYLRVTKDAVAYWAALDRDREVRRG